MDAIDVEYTHVKLPPENRCVYLSWNAFQEFLDDAESAFMKGGETSVTGVYPVNEHSYVMAQCLAERLGVGVCHSPISGCIAVCPTSDIDYDKFNHIAVVTWVRWTDAVNEPDYSYLTIDKGTKIVFPWGK